MKALKLSLIILLSVLFLNSCTISNNNVNHAPVILSEPITIAYLDEEYHYDVNAIDEDGDNLVYELTNLPEGMSIDINSGEIFWLPQIDQIGEHDVIISVDDGELSAIQSFTIVVQENNSQNNVLLEIIPETVVVTSGNPFTIDIVVENITELQGVTVGLSFNDSVIAYNTAADGGFLPAPIFFPPPSSSVTNQVLLSIAGTGIPPYSSGTGTVLTVTFDALAVGTTDISFYLTDLRHDVATPIPHKVKGECSVTVD
jgi:hypothetical protein